MTVIEVTLSRANDLSLVALADLASAAVPTAVPVTHFKRRSAGH